MLRRLELIGFKSFAERTRFEFAPGITAIVGPNGSGKSNIVDAVRWLLGEQSAKNLRGGEMTDVIFNGSSTRKSLGMAEVTMSFDNSTRILGVEADEVQITRRVFRDGEGEYLINQQPSRLKDIKELFLGSGAGHGAYSVIEQGRVDALLAASTKERRIIFEEAAGISRFKAKKLEALRKLDHVDQDLLRVNDILRELEKQLKTLRQQAAKAQRYQDYHTRLRELRLTASGREVRALVQQIQQETQRLSELREQLAQAAQESAVVEQQVQQLEAELARAGSALQQQEATLGEAREQIARAETIAQAERTQSENLEAESLRIGQQRAELERRNQLAQLEQGRLQESLAFAIQRVEAEERRAISATEALAAANDRIAVLSAQVQERRNQQFETVARVAKYQTEIQNSTAQLEKLNQDLRQKQAETLRVTSRHDNLYQLLEGLSESDAEVRQRLNQTRERLGIEQLQRGSLRERLEQVQANLELLREERSACRARTEVLDGLEQSFEGVGAGVRAVLEKLQQPEDHFRSAVLGLVADLLTVPREQAALIELALGDAAHRFVVRDETALTELTPTLRQLPGRVGFVPLQPGALPCTTPPPLIGEPLLAQVSSPWPDLPAQLLQQVWLVEDLATARQLRPGFPQFRFVTRAGELLEPDGTLIIGPSEQRMGILSRKSELRELRQELGRLDALIAEQEITQSRLRQQCEALDAQIQRAEEEIQALTSEAGGLREQILHQRQVQQQLAETLELLARERVILEEQLAEVTATQQRQADQLREAEAASTAVQQELDVQLAELTQAEQLREQRASEDTAAQVTVSRVRDQLQMLRQQQDELTRELEHWRMESQRLREAEAQAAARWLNSQLAALRATASAAPLYAVKQQAEAAIRELHADQVAHAAQREQLLGQLKQVRDQHAHHRDLQHSHDLVLHDLQTRRDNIVQRIRDEYGVELETTVEAAAEEELVPLVQADAAPGLETQSNEQDEIAELRAKLARLGGVNLEALAELAEQEQRDQALRAQLADLSESRKKLTQIIDQINSDSRRLFSETIQRVREHFQQLFRKLFAGGMADLVLEDEADILESGIEITVKPPGKETQRISLLSGGERALTAVALLMAIFQSKPSPFCLLDEVDAAMDEGNTQRLATLIQEFREKSQFIIITHKKRTMAAADLLYGVTMQESGVSKLVAVRFEDWPDDAPAANRQAA